MQDGSHLWQLALQKRKAGRCPLEPGEVAAILRAMGYPEETQIYVASGQVYGGKNRMAPLRNLFPNLVIILFSSCCMNLNLINFPLCSMTHSSDVIHALYILSLRGSTSIMFASSRNKYCTSILLYYLCPL